MKDQVEPEWLKISLDCPENLVEATTDLLGILSKSGVEQTPVVRGTSRVSGFFRLDEDRTRAQITEELGRELAALFSLYELTPPELEYSTLHEQDWATSWQQFFKPFAIIPGLIIKPGWEQYSARTGEQVIEMDPGMAFGTGQHASTKLALGLMRRCFQDAAPTRVLDIGTGTGILAMASALFGAEQVVAVDNDPEAVRVATENSAANGLDRVISCSMDGLEEIRGSFDLICANIVHDVLVAMAPAIVRLLAAEGRVVLSGILSGAQEKNIVSIYQSLDLTLLQATYEDEWVSLLFSTSG
jgi:ribosomal protein L11 methyltransferase